MTQDIAVIQSEVAEHLKDPTTVKTLIATTFKNLSQEVMKQAIVEGMIRGFTFKDFLQKDIYAVPFGQGYSLVISIDRARKIGARSGIVGKSEPVYDEEPELGLTCSVTVKKKFADGYVGDFTAKVYFKEFAGPKDIWRQKPRVMIAKVAEMHALRQACPEELAQIYDEDELTPERTPVSPINPDKEIEDGKAKLDAAKTLEELSTAWANLPPAAKVALGDYKNQLKKNYEKPAVQ